MKDENEHEETPTGPQRDVRNPIPVEITGANTQRIPPDPVGGERTEATAPDAAVKRDRPRTVCRDDIRATVAVEIRGRNGTGLPGDRPARRPHRAGIVDPGTEQFVPRIGKRKQDVPRPRLSRDTASHNPLAARNRTGSAEIPLPVVQIEMPGDGFRAEACRIGTVVAVEIPDTEPAAVARAPDRDRPRKRSVAAAGKKMQPPVRRSRCDKVRMTVQGEIRRTNRDSRFGQR